VKGVLEARGFTEVTERPDVTIKLAAGSGSGASTYREEGPALGFIGIDIFSVSSGNQIWRRCERRPASHDRATATEASHEEQQEKGADDAPNDAGGVQIGHAVLRHQRDQEAADERARDAEQRRGDEPHALSARHDRARQETNDQAEYDEKKNAHL